MNKSQSGKSGGREDASNQAGADRQAIRSNGNPPKPLGSPKKRGADTKGSVSEAPDYARLHRLLKIIALIQGQSGWNATRLAAECGVAQRTIYRDLQLLEGAGIPYFFDERQKSYQIRRDFFLRPVELTLDESLALVALGEHIGGREQIPFTRAATRAVAKIRSQLPDRIRTALEGLDRHIAIKLAATNSPYGLEDVYEKLRRAITDHRVLRCQYESLRGARDGESFLFKPYTLFFSQRAWYAVGYHDTRKEIRCLKLARFTAIEVTHRTYMVPVDFSLKKHLGNAWRMIRGPRKFAVEILFDREFAETIADTQWHETQVIEYHDDGSITFRCQVDGLEEIVWWVLSMGPHCTAKNPPELAQQVRELADQIVKLYPGRLKET